MIVMKFGGSSVASREQIAKVLRIVQGRQEQRPLVVSSAHKGITDGLVAAAKAAASGDGTVPPVIERQRIIARDLGCKADLLEPLFAELCDLLRGLSLVKELSPRSLDFVSSFGERLSVRCIADFFTREGLPSTAYDVWDLGFCTDESFGHARPVEGYQEAVRAAYETIDLSRVPVVTGFIGRTIRGEITTVGRNGSDLTATLLAAALGAEVCQIWSDTDGVMTADPSVVAAARNIPTMRFSEAAELAYFGSRVLHPATLMPAIAANIPVRVLNTNRPEHQGTVIESAPAPNPRLVTSIAYKEDQLAVSIRSAQMFGAAGFLGRLFELLGRHKVVVDMLATSEVSVCFTTDNAEPLSRALPELRALGDLHVDEGRALLVVVGQHLSARSGIAADLLGAVSSAGVNVEMISYAMESVSFTMLIKNQDIGAAVRTLHARLCETDC